MKNDQVSDWLTLATLSLFIGTMAYGAAIICTLH